MQYLSEVHPENSSHISFDLFMYFIHDIIGRLKLSNFFFQIIILNVFVSKASDGLGREAKLTVWSHPGNDVSGMVARSEKVAGTCEKVL